MTIIEYIDNHDHSNVNRSNNENNHNSNCDDDKKDRRNQFFNQNFKCSLIDHITSAYIFIWNCS